MSLVTLGYVSRSLIGAQSPEMRALARRAASHNRMNCVTGVLYFDGRQFLQVLEGDPGLVAPLFARIRGDARHHDVHVLFDAPISSRRFAAWEMKLVDGTSFAHLQRHFDYERLRIASAGQVDRRLRLLEQL